MISRHPRHPTSACLLFVMLSATACATPPASPEAQWWKGNLHTHTLWSDGFDYPEVAAEWYKEHGWNFVVFTEHDRLMEGEEWLDVLDVDGPQRWPRSARAQRMLPAYRERFGGEWVEERQEGDAHLVRLRDLDELRRRYEEPSRFLLLMGEEISAREAVHVNAINLGEAIEPLDAETRPERLAANLAAVHEQSERTGRAMIAIVNHPNFGWALTADDIAASEARFFEVYNAHGEVRNEGDSLRANIERIWDIALAKRHAAGRASDQLYGVAVDDTHHYDEESPTVARPGRAWIRVRASRLEPGALIEAMERGHFHASTGVALRDVRFDGRTLAIEIDGESDVTYTTRFIGTREGYSLDGEPVIDAEGTPIRTTLRYPPGIGEVLAEVEGVSPAYTLTGDEVYVRAVVISSRRQVDPTTGDTLRAERAWVQPVFR